MISGVQTLDFGKWIAVEIDSEQARNKILTEGVVIGNHTVYFQQHRRREYIKVYVNQLPLGISQDDVRATFSHFGRIYKFWPVKKPYFDRQLCTGDWCNHFRCLDRAYSILCKH